MRFTCFPRCCRLLCLRRVMPLMSRLMLLDWLCRMLGRWETFYLGIRLVRRSTCLARFQRRRRQNGRASLGELRSRVVGWEDLGKCWGLEQFILPRKNLEHFDNHDSV